MYFWLVLRGVPKAANIIVEMSADSRHFSSPAAGQIKWSLNFDYLALFGTFTFKYVSPQPEKIYT
jgi:hypothetical protein